MSNFSSFLLAHHIQHLECGEIIHQSWAEVGILGCDAAAKCVTAFGIHRVPYD